MTNRPDHTESGHLCSFVIPLFLHLETYLGHRYNKPSEMTPKAEYLQNPHPPVRIWLMWWTLRLFFGQLIDPKHTWFACLLLSSGTGLSRGNGGVGLSNAFFVWSYRFPNISVTCRCCTRTRIHLPLNARSRLCVV